MFSYIGLSYYQCISATSRKRIEQLLPQSHEPTLSFQYGLFGFTFKPKLSTRPEKYQGDIQTWNEAESRLATALD